MANELSKDEWMQLLAELGKRNQTTGQMVPTTGQSETITSRELELGDGGGGGMDMMSSFTNLGDKIQKNALSTISMFSGMRNEDRDRRRAEGLDIENKRQFNENLKLGTRDRNLTGMEILANIRGQAGERARNRTPFMTALGNAVR